MNAIGLSRDWGLGSLRVTLGVHTTPADIDAFLTTLPELAAKARKLS
jgi:cysteine sulfinate desulfinase/cysteine desulfurase-like protein